MLIHQYMEEHSIRQTEGMALRFNERQFLDFERMVEILKQITVIHAVPSLLRAILTYIEDKQIAPQQFQALRHVSTVGDMVPIDILERMKKAFQYAEIFVILEIPAKQAQPNIEIIENAIANRLGQKLSVTVNRIVEESINSSLHVFANQITQQLNAHLLNFKQSLSFIPTKQVVSQK